MNDTPDGPRTSYLEWSAEGRASLGRYLVGTALVVLIFFVLSGVGAFPITVLDPDYQESLLESDLALFLAFGISFVGIPWVVHLVHRRPWWSVAMPTRRFNRADLALGFWVSTILGVVLIVGAGAVGVVDLEVVVPDWVLWSELLIIGGVGVFVQAGSEELLFRGYFTQFGRRFTSNPVVFVTIPAILFAVPHLSNLGAYSGSALIKLAPYLASGLLYGWAAYRSGSLWLGLGLHLSNNLTNIVLVGPRGDVLETVAPIQFELTDLTVGAVLTIIGVVLQVVVLEWFLRRREADGHVTDSRATPTAPSAPSA
jgi:membrane protease YdiL (CAAX protease family)